MHASPARATRRPFDRPQDRFGRDDGLRRTRPFARPSGLNWLQIAMRIGDEGSGADRALDALGPFDRPLRSRR
jgi:hypothetical protein